jgi:glycosyltransferase involved in cell wall biosynthesis
MSKVAIITRTKDRPLFLARALKSVTDQTYTDYTHVIISDGGGRESIDKAVEMLDSSAKQRVKIFVRPKHSDAPDTIFNESIDRVDSTYIAIHDDDDTWHPEFLEHTVAHLEQTKSQAVIVRTDKKTEEINESLTSIRHIKTEPWMPEMKVINLYRQCIENQLTPIATLFSREAYKAVGKFDDSLAVCGDWEFGIRFLQKYDIDFLDPGFALANYHHRRYKPGAQGNTSFAGNDRHRYYTNKIMNKYLRSELAEGRFGPGYIMSKTKYEQNFIARTLFKLMPRFLSTKINKRAKS